MLTVDKKQFVESIEYVKKSVAKDSNRPMFNGIHLKYKEDKLVIEACDGFRMARTWIKCTINNLLDEDFDIIMPYKKISDSKKSISQLQLEVTEIGEKKIFGINR